MHPDVLHPELHKKEDKQEEDKNKKKKAEVKENVTDKKNTANQEKTAGDKVENPKNKNNVKKEKGQPLKIWNRLGLISRKRFEALQNQQKGTTGSEEQGDKGRSKEVATEDKSHK